MLGSGREVQRQQRRAVRHQELMRWLGAPRCGSLPLLPVLQSPHRGVRELGFLPERHGVYVSRWHHGSPAHRYGGWMDWWGLGRQAKGLSTKPVLGCRALHPLHPLTVSFRLPPPLQVCTLCTLCQVTTAVG